jgi:hypothetical protein
MKKFLATAAFLLILALSGCALIGIGLPAELKGSWSDSTSYGYTKTFTFTSDRMYYEDYASNTGGSSSWNEEIISVNTTEEFFVTKYDCWSWHISGSTLYLKKEAYSETPDPNLPDSWWSDTSIGKHTLTKD